MTQVEGDSARPADDQSKQPKRDRTHWLYILVIVGVVAGVVVGWWRLTLVSRSVCSARCSST